MSAQAPVVAGRRQVAAALQEATSRRHLVDTFTQEFDILAEAGAGVGTLRQLVIDLAVRGLLVEQREADGNGAELALSMLDELRRSFSGRLNHGGDADADISLEPFALPSTWAWSTVGHVSVKLGAGSTPLGGKSVYKASGVKFLRSQNVWNDGLRLADVAYIDRALHEQMGGTHVRPGDLLLNITGASIGRAVVVPDVFDEANVSQHVAIVRLVDKSVRRFVHLAITSTYFQQLILDVQVGVSREGLSMKKLKHLPIPVPPLAEQKRIVAKVDQLMALCDELEARQAKKREVGARLTKSALDALTSAEGPEEFDTAWKRVVENFEVLIDRAEKVEVLRANVLGLAVRGLLTGAASDDLGRCHGSDKSAEVASAESANGDLPFALPGGWKWARIREQFEVTGGIQKTPFRTPRANHYPYLRVENVQRGRLELERVERFELEVGELERRRLNTGDLLVVEGNGSAKEIGRCAIWTGVIENCVHQNHIIRCRPTGEVTSSFALLFLNSPFGMAEMRRLAITTSGLYSLSVGKIRELVIPIPPAAEQARIVAKVDQLVSLCDALEAKLAHAEERASMLVEAVVSETVAQPPV